MDEDILVKTLYPTGNDLAVYVKKLADIGFRDAEIARAVSHMCRAPYTEGDISRMLDITFPQRHFRPRDPMLVFKKGIRALLEASPGGVLNIDPEERSYEIAIRLADAHLLTALKHLLLPDNIGVLAEAWWYTYEIATSPNAPLDVMGCVRFLSDIVVAPETVRTGLVRRYLNAICAGDYPMPRSHNPERLVYEIAEFTAREIRKYEVPWHPAVTYWMAAQRVLKSLKCHEQLRPMVRDLLNAEYNLDGCGPHNLEMVEERYGHEPGRGRIVAWREVENLSKRLRNRRWLRQLMLPTAFR